MSAENQKAYQGLLREYQRDWVFMAHHALGHMTWRKQREVIRSVQENKYTVVRACHSSSKTFSAAEIAAIFFNIYPDSRVITTAPIFPQVEKLLWKEIGDIYKSPKIQLMGRCLSVEVKDPNAPKHYMYGFSTDQPAKAEGFHAPNILYIFDEAKGIESWMWDSAYGSMTGGNAKWLAISTTDGVQVGSPFYKCFQPGSRWNQIHISAYDSPMVTGEKFEKFEFPEPGNIMKFRKVYIDPKDVNIQIATQEWIDEMADPLSGWGRESVLFKTKVLGEICDIGSDAIIRISQTNQMFKNGENPDFDESGAKRAGIDVAWGGANDTVVFKAKGNKILDFPLVISTPDLPPDDIVGFQGKKIAEYLNFDREYELHVDVASGGIGLVSWLQADGWNVVPVNNGEKSDKPDIYDSMASQIWFEGSKLIQDIACPKIPRLEKELLQRKQVPLTPKGKLKIESKKDYMKRGFDSPDFADAFLLVWLVRLGIGGYAGETQGDFYG